MILDSTTRSLQVVLGEATVTTACDIVASYAKATVDTFVTATAMAATTGTTAVTVLAHPPYGSQYLVTELRVHNNDTIAHRVTLRLLDGVTARILLSQVIPANGDFLYTPGGGTAAAVTALVAGQIVGTATNDNAAAGNVGEFISATVLAGSGVALVTGTPVNVTSISLTPGDWDVRGNVGFTLTSGASNIQAWVSATSATVPVAPGAGGYTVLAGSGSAYATGSLLGAGLVRFSLAATTSIYLSAWAALTAGTATVFGFIGARRVR